MVNDKPLLISVGRSLLFYCTVVGTWLDYIWAEQRTILSIEYNHIPNNALIKAWTNRKWIAMDFPDLYSCIERKFRLNLNVLHSLELFSFQKGFQLSLYLFHCVLLFEWQCVLIWLQTRTTDFRWSLFQLYLKLLGRSFK